MPQPGANESDLAACRALLCSGSRSFYAASLLLPKRIRGPATALYAFCREADDAIDLGDDPLNALAQLHERLDAAYAGVPWQSPVDRAFAATVAQYQIPKSLPSALIEGLAWDSQGRRYQDLSDLLDYAARVAGSVGVMMALVMGVRDAAALARAADLGVAMQLSNIARDVGEDARAGRLFLPLNWLATAGIDAEAFIENPIFSIALGGVVQTLLAQAETLYANALSGITLLPLDCRTGIAAARRIYAAIGAEIAQQSHDSISRRARVSGRRKIILVFHAVLDTVFSVAEAQLPILPANLFLLQDAVVETAFIQDQPKGFVKLITMFERLERAQRDGILA